MAGLNIEVARAKASLPQALLNNKTLRGLRSEQLYRISVSDGKTSDDILIHIYKNGQLNSIINFHSNNKLQYNMALNIINNTTLYRTESINSLINRLKGLKSVQFYEI